MLKKTVYRLLRHRHFWRDAGFDELSELYISMMFRGLAISLSGLFIPLYMLELHFSLAAVMSTAAWFFTFRAFVFDPIAMFCTAKIGPKHTIVIGYILLICSNGLFLTLPSVNWPIWLLGLLWGGSASLFFIPFHVDFSKVKHSEHGGKELGYIQTMERIGAALGPLVGGIIATVFTAKYVFFAGVILLFVGLIPLFRTGEAVKTHQRLDFSGLPIHKIRRDLFSYCALGIENTFCILLWPLFLALFVFNNSYSYAKLGSLVTIAMGLSIFSAIMIGKRVDKQQGRKLLRISATVNALLHLGRPFALVLPTAAIIGLANEAVTVGYRLPFMKGMYDRADSLPGFRIVYIGSMEMIGSIAKGCAWWLLVILTSFLSAYSVLVVGFMIAALASVIIQAERFTALDT